MTIPKTVPGQSSATWDLGEPAPHFHVLYDPLCPPLSLISYEKLKCMLTLAFLGFPQEINFLSVLALFGRFDPFTNFLLA